MVIVPSFISFAPLVFRVGIPKIWPKSHLWLPPKLWNFY